MDNVGKFPRVIVNKKTNGRTSRKPEQAEPDERAGDELRSNSTEAGVLLNSWEIQALDLMIGMVPEVREAQVRKFRKQIAAGAYQVSAEEIADKIIAAYSAKSLL